MVGIVVASHSRSLAEGVVEVARMMAPDVPIIAAGGMDDGSMGTSCRKIIGAVKQVYSDDGVALIADIGSSILSAEMAVEILKRPNLKLWTVLSLKARLSQRLNLSSARRWLKLKPAPFAPELFANLPERK